MRNANTFHHRYTGNRRFSLYKRQTKPQNDTEVEWKMETLTWEILILISHHLDPKTLAIASCVSKSWSNSMSSDLLWKPIVTTNFPSLATLPPAVSYRRIFALGHTAAVRRRKTPSIPRLSLGEIIFAVSITSTRDSRVVAEATRSCDALVADPPGVFRFGVCCDGGVTELEVVKVTWNVVVKGWRGVFTVMDCEGKVGGVGGGGWFSQGLPGTGCCEKAVGNSVVAEMKVGVCGGENGGVRVEKVSVGILSVVKWRYVCIEDALRYLQHFLLT